jgi:hypothetical protein
MRITGVDGNTIMKALVLAGERCEKLMARLVVNVPVKDVQADEIWPPSPPLLATVATMRSTSKSMASPKTASAGTAPPKSSVRRRPQSWISQKVPDLRFARESAYCLWFAFYNFCRVHKTIRVTPAMEAGITDHIWNLKELLS